VSGKGALKLDATEPEQAQGDDQVAARDRQFHVGDPIPYVLTKTELADATGYSPRQIDRFRRDFTHPGIKQLEGPGHPRFCGRTLKAWIDGTRDEPARRQFFGSARKRS
jgi:hypothetical protein